MSGLAGTLAMAGRLARDLGPFLRSPLTPAAARSLVRRDLDERAARFLALADRAIYDNPRSPYRPLLRAAGCERGDLHALVAGMGLEGALTRLARDGVYVAFDEFKGRAPAVRGSARFHFREEDFDHPGLAPHYLAHSGGTRGAATPVRMHLAFVADLAASTALALDAHGLTGHAHVIWLLSGVTPTLIYSKLGRAPLRWLCPVPAPPMVRVGARFLAGTARLHGVRLPRLTRLDVTRPDELAAGLAALVRGGTPVCVTTYASSAARIATAAAERGLDLRGACFITLGEPFTAGKRELIEAVGARALPRYAFTEAGIIGYGCPSGEAADDLHVSTDGYAVLTRARPVAGSGLAVDAFLFTSLRPTAPKILLNVESGDHGRLTARACGCPLEAAGLSTHVSHIRSFEKLSGEGMSFVHADLLGLLEEVLPRRFGGTGADYQLVEEERDGVLRAVLVVSPRVGSLDEASVRRALLDHLGDPGGKTAGAVRVWERANTVVISRRLPVATRSGKILPFQIERRASGPDQN
jgi:hypothetical protein